MANGLVSDFEINFQLKQLHIDDQIRAEKDIHDRHAHLSRRQIEQEIKQTRHTLEDIHTKTMSPTARLKLNVPEIKVSDETSDSNLDNEVTLTFDPHVRLHTRQNIQTSRRLSRSLERRERNRCTSPLAVTNLVSVSSRSIENLHKAACVLKNTQHEGDVQALLSSVKSKNTL